MCWPCERITAGLTATGDEVSRPFCLCTGKDHCPICTPVTVVHADAGAWMVTASIPLDDGRTCVTERHIGTNAYRMRYILPPTGMCIGGGGGGGTLTSAHGGSAGGGGGSGNAAGPVMAQGHGGGGGFKYAGTTEVSHITMAQMVPRAELDAHRDVIQRLVRLLAHVNDSMAPLDTRESIRSALREAWECIEPARAAAKRGGR